MGLAEGQGCFHEVQRTSGSMGKGGKVPHDRGHLLWTSAEGPSNRLLASIDRWVGVVLADDGIDMPLMGRAEAATATVLARSEGLVAGTAAVHHLLQIWAPEVRVSWSASDGRQVGNGDEIGRLTGPADVLLTIERSVSPTRAVVRHRHLGPGLGHSRSGRSPAQGNRVRLDGQMGGAPRGLPDPSAQPKGRADAQGERPRGLRRG